MNIIKLCLSKSLLSLYVCYSLNLNSQTHIDLILGDLQKDDSIIKLFEHEFRDFPNNSQLSIGIVKNDTTYFLGFKKNRDAIYQTNNIDSIFEIGSLTKVFTSSLYANAIIEGKIDANKSIKKYLDFSLNEGKMLIKHTII